MCKIFSWFPNPFSLFGTERNVWKEGQTDDVEGGVGGVPWRSGLFHSIWRVCWWHGSVLHFRLWAAGCLLSGQPEPVGKKRLKKKQIKMIKQTHIFAALKQKLFKEAKYNVALSFLQMCSKIKGMWFSAWMKLFECIKNKCHTEKEKYQKCRNWMLTWTTDTNASGWASLH